MSTDQEPLTKTERQRMADAEHDVAYAVVNGIAPRTDDVAILRDLYAKRDRFYAQLFEDQA